MNLRFILRDGKKILQREKRTGCEGKFLGQWEDVPFINEKCPREFWVVESSHGRFIYLDEPNLLGGDAQLFKVREVLQ